jgi:hypothetical protein
MDPKIMKNETNEDKKETLDEIMADLANKVNPKSVAEGIAMVTEAAASKDPSTILGPMASGAKEFEERTGRRMTYMEMRMMWG